MRMTQIQGLTGEAMEFLRKNCIEVPSTTCPACKHVLSYCLKSEVYEDAARYGMFEDGPALNKYFLKNGSTVKEIVQAVPWSSGPCIFMCLEDEKGKKLFEWSEKDIENC